MIMLLFKAIMSRNFNKNKRLYVFIDETGDPGYFKNPSSSNSYQLNIISV